MNYEIELHRSNNWMTNNLDQPMHNWLNKEIGWSEYYYDYTKDILYFNYEEDKMMFILKWI